MKPFLRTDQWQFENRGSLLSCRKLLALLHSSLRLGDKAAAKQAFALSGDKPGGSVWHDRNAFLEAKKWAETP
jgi:hypothetical protein